jgi:hypothetical protein
MYDNLRIEKTVFDTDIQLDVCQYSSQARLVWEYTAVARMVDYGHVQRTLRESFFTACLCA